MTDEAMLKFVEFRIAELTPVPGEHPDRLKIGMVVAFREMAEMLNGVTTTSALCSKDGTGGAPDA